MIGEKRIMSQNTKSNKALMKENSKNSDFSNNEPETEIIKVFETFSKETELEKEDVECKLKDSCYVAKNKMGQCPCELFA